MNKDKSIEIKKMEKSRELYLQGREAMDSGDRQRAIEIFKQSCSEAPHFKTFELLGETLIAEGNYNEAIVYLAAAAGLGEKQFRARFLLAKALLALGDVWRDNAVEQLKKSIKLNPDYQTAKELLNNLSEKDKE